MTAASKVEHLVFLLLLVVRGIPQLLMLLILTDSKADLTIDKGSRSTGRIGHLRASITYKWGKVTYFEISGWEYNSFGKIVHKSTRPIIPEVYGIKEPPQQLQIHNRDGSQIFQGGDDSVNSEQFSRVPQQVYDQHYREPYFGSGEENITSVKPSNDQPTNCGQAVASRIEHESSSISFDEIAQSLQSMVLYRPSQAVVSQDAPAAHFRPTNMALRMKGELSPIIPTAGIYLGNTNSAIYRNQVRNLPNSDNCALFIIGLPVVTDHALLLGGINTGAVVLLDIKEPKGVHTTKAATLVFKTPEAAARFYQRSLDECLFILGRRVRVVYNHFGHLRHKFKHQSRVIHIEGPENHAFMNERFWDSYFKNFCSYQREVVRYEVKSGRVIMKFGFARISAQSQACMQAINRDPQFLGIIQARYGNDPCEIPCGFCEPGYVCKCNS